MQEQQRSLCRQRLQAVMRKLQSNAKFGGVKVSTGV